LEQPLSKDDQDRLFKHTLRLTEEGGKVSIIPSAIDPGLLIIPNIINAQEMDFQSAL
jgi:hypothetical protein